VAAATQNQAMNALVFLYRKVLAVTLDESIDAVRAERKVHVPVVMTRAEVVKVVSLIGGVPQLIVKMLYGSGLRVLEAVRLRVKDLDFAMKQVTVRSGKGEKDRVTTLSAAMMWPPR
jgi:site-specific recombinase XerD